MKVFRRIGIAVLSVFLGICLCFLGFASSYRRPYRAVVEGSGVSPATVYAVMKAESGFSESARSEQGAVGMMQLMPSTAQFVCELKGIAFEAERLNEGEYNTTLGCFYLSYLLERFANEKTALAAYNAGEGIVRKWLQDRQYSKDGCTLMNVPYRETADYLKKVEKIKKIYEIFYY